MNLASRSDEDDADNVPISSKGETFNQSSSFLVQQSSSYLRDIQTRTDEYSSKIPLKSKQIQKQVKLKDKSFNHDYKELPSAAAELNDSNIELRRPKRELNS
jgi:hypothetical protein